MDYKEQLKHLSLNKKHGIYKLTINYKIYIGSAVNLNLRLTQHYNDLLANRHRNMHLQRSFNLYNSISFDIIEFVDDKNNLINREQYFIDKLLPDYNIAKKAGSQLGFIHSEKTKLHLSNIQKNKNISSETRLKMKMSKIGIKLNESHKKNISESKKGSKNPFYKAGINHPQYGTHRSESTKLKLSNSHSNSGVMYDFENNVNYIFQNLKTLCSHFNFNYRGVLSALRANRFYINRYYFDFIHIPNCSSTKLEVLITKDQI